MGGEMTGINAKQLRQYIIRPALNELGLWTQEAEDLLIGTAAQESGCGHYLHQLGNGPAVGIFQMEPRSYDDLCVWISSNRKNEWTRIWTHTQQIGRDGNWPPATRMIWDLKFAAMMCRMFYLRKPGAIPSTLQGQAEYWKKYYNTAAGKGTVQEYIRNYPE